MKDLASELRKVPLLTAVSEEDINKLVESGGVRLEHCRRGAVVIERGTPGDAFYIVLMGQLRARVGPEVKREFYHPRWDYSGERALLTGEPRQATVEVYEEADLAVFTKTAFEWLIDRYPKIKAYLEERMVRWQKPLPRDFRGKYWNEDTAVFERRHIFALLERIGKPSLAAILLLFLGYALDFPPGVHIPIVGVYIHTDTAVVLTLIALVLWGLYSYIDWTNDHFIVTSERVIHIERIFLYSESRDEAPLERVLDVTLDRPGFSYKLLGFHDVVVKTAGTSPIRFTKAANGEGIRKAIQGAREEVMQRRSEAEKELIRQELRRQLGLEEKEKTPAIAPELAARKRAEPRETRPLLGPLGYFLPYQRIVDAEKDEITWRKHWIILARRTVLPFLCVFCPPIASLLLLLYTNQISTACPSPLFLTTVVISLAAIPWLLWQYEDWRNDIYVVTRDRLIDIKRSPFGLLGESRRDSYFEAVQDVTYKIPGLLHRLLNLGNVNIQIVGAEALKFHQVFHPIDVQQEIFNRLVEFQEQRRREEQLRSIKDLGTWFGQYKKVAEEVQRPREKS
jgi:hypothetical protein